MRINEKKYNISNNNIETKIIHISDIHFQIKYDFTKLEKIKTVIKKHHPNYICITGDLIDDSSIIKNAIFKKYIKWLEELSLISKLIISIGNHEYMELKNKKYQQNENIDWLKKIKNDQIIVLDNNIYNSANITFIGYNPDYNYYENKNQNKEKYNNELANLIEKTNQKYTILLLHTPSLILKNNNQKNIKNFDKINLILCGHTHGGMIPDIIPGNFGLISPEGKLFPQKVRGKIKLKNQTLIINSGIMKLSKKSKLSRLSSIYSSSVIIIEIKKT